MAEGNTREEVLASYEHPYRRWLPVAYRMHHMRELLAALVALIAVTAVLAVARDDGAPDLLVVLSYLATVLAAVWTAYITVASTLAIRDRMADWRRTETHELARVREQRPHAGDGEGRYASTQYAVAVGQGGELVTWAFEPLAAHEPPSGHLLLSGTPRYAASPVERVPFDARDTARAAEQLVEAQALAADWEAEAAEHAAHVRAGNEAASELAEESESTGAALRRLTGQSPR